MWNEQRPGCFWETISGWWWCRESPFIQRAAPSQCVQYRPDTPSHHHYHHPLPVSVSLPLCSPNSASRITWYGIAVMATGASLGALLCSLCTVGYKLPLSWTHSCQCPKPLGYSSLTSEFIFVCFWLYNKICYFKVIKDHHKLTKAMWFEDFCW